MRDPQNLAGSKLKIPTVQRILERSDKSPFDKGGFRGNVDALITRKGELFDSPFLVIPAVEEVVLVYLKHSKRCVHL